MAGTRATVVGIFHSCADAERALGELRRAGFSDDQVGFLAREGRAGEATPSRQTSEVGGPVGAATGGVLGGLAGLAATAGLVTIPGVGPLLAGGAAATALGGASVGGAAGALVEALGMPEEEARCHACQLGAGDLLVTVRAEGRRQEAAAILRGCGASTEPDGPAPA